MLVVSHRVRVVLQVERGEREFAVFGTRGTSACQHVGSAAPGGARRAHGVLGARHVARGQRPLRATAAAGGPPARGLGAALLHGDGRAARQQRAADIRGVATSAAARVRRILHLGTARHRHAGARTERLPLRAHSCDRLRRTVDCVFGVDFLRSVGGLHQLRVVLPVLKTFP